MKHISAFSLLAAVFALLPITSATTFAQGTAFTYQGRLNQDGTAAHGSYDLAFTLFATNTSGVAIAGPVTNAAVLVSDGLFTTIVDFGSVFTGTSNWLEIAVSTNGAATFTTLAPRQQLTPVPYAIRADTAGSVSGVLPTSVLPGFQPPYHAIGGGQSNTIQTSSPYSVIGGGAQNVVASNSPYAFVGGGDGNVVRRGYAVIGGGYRNVASGDANFPEGDSATVAGGWENTAAGNAAVVAGGYWNYAKGDSSAIGGGNNNTNYAAATFIGGGINNNVRPSAHYSLIGGGQNNLVGTNAFHALIAGGHNNTVGINSHRGFIGGGQNNTISNDSSHQVIGGGLNNTILPLSYGSTIGGGLYNIAQGYGAVIPGGWSNSATANYTFAAGYNARATNAGSFVWADGQGTPFSSSNTNQFNVRANGGIRFVASGAGMTLDGAAVLTASNLVPQAALGAAGSYTPRVGNGGTNFVTSQQSGYYAKVGNLVYFEAYVAWSSKGTATSGNLLVSLPPIAPLSFRPAFTIGFVDGITNAGQLIATGISGSTNFNIDVRNAMGIVATIPVTTVLSAGQVQVSGTYRWQ
ncbi:MAG: hypothetical protein QM813_22605 [Verrucomicrobiota bacterium]